VVVSTGAEQPIGQPSPQHGQTVLLMLKLDLTTWSQTPEDRREAAMNAAHTRTRERFLALYELTQQERGCLGGDAQNAASPADPVGALLQCRWSAGVGVQVHGRRVPLRGEGEWTVRQHGDGKRRTWIKVHLAVDARAKDVIGVRVTTPAWTDGEVVGRWCIKNRRVGFPFPHCLRTPPPLPGPTSAFPGRSSRS
jgi:hypothetical protein